jgi:hypothetical protein
MVTWTEDKIVWDSQALISDGYIKSEEEWYEFSDMMTETAMQYFTDKAHRELGEEN